jgi:hypothetical protein
VRTASEILGALLASDPEPRTLLTRLCQDCADTVPMSSVGLALMNDAGHQGVVAVSDGPAAAMEELQFSLGEGPCFEASRARRPVLQPDIAGVAERRWPLFGREAVAAGIAAIFALPLHVGAIRIGVLDLYRSTPGSLNETALGEALAYAEAAVLVLLQLQGQESRQGTLHPQLAHPLENRAEVHQATGIVSVSAAVSLADALMLLRARAFTTQRPILAIARDVVAGILLIESPRDDHE